MKKLIFATFIFIVVSISTKALEPVRIGLNYPNPSGSLTVSLVNVATGQEIESVQINNVEANSSGVVSLVVGENDPDWTVQPASLTSNPSVMLRVFDNGVFIKQFVFRDLVTTQASTGNGDVLDDGFNSTGGLTTSGETTDDFLFGAQAIPFTGGLGGFINTGIETKFFFKKNIGAFRAGAVDGTSWDTTSLGQYSTGFGFNTEASGNSAFAAGNESVASGDYSTAFGFYSTATGEGSFAAGSDTEADGDYSSAFGIGTTAPNTAEFAIGSYNTVDEGEGASRLFVVGNGDNTEGIFRSDAFEVFSDGNARVHNDLEVDNDAYINGFLEVDGVGYPGSGASEGQFIGYNSESGDAEWTDLPLFTISTNSTLTGDGNSEVPLGIDLTAANTWTGNTTFNANLSLTKSGMTGNGNQALYTDDNGLVSAGSGETVQNAAGIYAGTAAWGTGNTLTISDAAVDTGSIITISYVGNDTVHLFRVDNVTSGTFDVITDSQTDPTGTIHYMIINQ